MPNRPRHSMIDQHMDSSDHMLDARCFDAFTDRTGGLRVHVSAKGVEKGLGRGGI